MKIGRGIAVYFSVFWILLSIAFINIGAFIWGNKLESINEVIFLITFMIVGYAYSIFQIAKTVFDSLEIYEQKVIIYKFWRGVEYRIQFGSIKEVELYSFSAKGISFNSIKIEAEDIKEKIRMKGYSRSGLECITREINYSKKDDNNAKGINIKYRQSIGKTMTILANSSAAINIFCIISRMT